VGAGGFAVVYKARASHGGLYALKRMAVNNPEDLHLARQEVAITVSEGGGGEEWEEERRIMAAIMLGYFPYSVNIYCIMYCQAATPPVRSNPFKPPQTVPV